MTVNNKPPSDDGIEKILLNVHFRVGRSRGNVAHVVGLAVFAFLKLRRVVVSFLIFISFYR